MVKDLVCGMGLDEGDPDVFSKSFEGAMYYFCSPDCMSLFMKEPSDYIKSRRKGTTVTKDLICAMEVDENNPPFTAVYEGKMYYFCSDTCKKEFERSPEIFVKKKKSGSKP